MRFWRIRCNGKWLINKFTLSFSNVLLTRFCRENNLAARLTWKRIDPCFMETNWVAIVGIEEQWSITEVLQTIYQQPYNPNIHRITLEESHVERQSIFFIRYSTVKTKHHPLFQTLIPLHITRWRCSRYYTHKWISRTKFFVQTVVQDPRACRSTFRVTREDSPPRSSNVH